MIKNIILDMGNVLIEYDVNRPLDALCPNEESKKIIRRELFESEYWRESGKNIYVLSNASGRFYEYFPRFYDMDFFDGVVVSCDLHIIKPDRRIYEYILNKYGLKAEECLFIDDLERNVRGAEKVGINAVRFENNYGEITEKYGL